MGRRCAVVILDWSVLADCFKDVNRMAVTFPEYYVKKTSDNTKFVFSLSR